MAYDPSLPTDHGDNSSAEMRAQLSGLRSLIDSIPVGPEGPPGEVTVADLQQGLVNERINHARNPVALSALNLVVSDPPTQGEMQAVATRLDVLLAELTRQP